MTPQTETALVPAPAVRRPIQRWRGGIEGAIRRQPVVAIALAAVAGVIAGRLIHLLARRARHRWVERGTRER